MKRTPLSKRGKSITSILQKQCDKLFQLKGRLLYPKCEICLKPSSCLHHFFPKSVSARLRYDWDNLIPICNGCHMQHHQAGNPRIHQTVIAKRGKQWYETLNKKSREYVKTDKAYYEYILEMLQ